MKFAGVLLLQSLAAHSFRVGLLRPVSFSSHRRSVATWPNDRTTTTAIAVDRRYKYCKWNVFSSSKGDSSSDVVELKRIPPDMEGVAIPFIDVAGNSFIECYADSVAHVDGVEYTIGVPCDYSVALCYFDENSQLVAVEVDDELMDDIFPLAESIVAEEFGEELVLQRTPQTLTLVGELEEDEEEEEDSVSDDEDEDKEQVEVLLSFEHRGKDFQLVRLLNPILLVGKVDPSAPGNRLLLTPQESDRVMPILEEAFLDSQGVDCDDDDDDEEEEELLP